MSITVHSTPWYLLAVLYIAQGHTVANSGLHREPYKTWCPLPTSSSNLNHLLNKNFFNWFSLYNSMQKQKNNPKATKAG